MVQVINSDLKCGADLRRADNTKPRGGIPFLRSRRFGFLTYWLLKSVVKVVALLLNA